MEEQEMGLEHEQGTESSKPYLVWTEQNRNWQNCENHETRANAAVRLNGFWSKHVELRHLTRIQRHSLKELESSWLWLDMHIWELLEVKVDKRLTFSKVLPIIYEKGQYISKVSDIIVGATRWYVWRIKYWQSPSHNNREEIHIHRKLTRWVEKPFVWETICTILCYTQ